MPVQGLLHHEIAVDAEGGAVRLHVVEAPRPSAQAQPLLLLPGQAMPWESYRRVLPRLSRTFHVFALDVRGHGQSAHAPGRYSFSRCAQDVVELLGSLVPSPALVAGNSSGGIIGMVAAARAPARVRGLLMEDPPLFSTDWPRLRDDTWVHGFFVHTVRTLPDLATYFSTLKLPTRGRKKLMSFPRPLAWLLGHAIRRHQRRWPGRPVDLPWLPLHVRLFVRGLSEYDVDFTKACVDGRMCDVEQAAVLAAVRCPITLMTASSFRHETLGLVGAMDDEDVRRAQGICPGMRVVRLEKPHVLHLAAPKVYCAELARLAERC